MALVFSEDSVSKEDQKKDTNLAAGGLIDIEVNKILETKNKNKDNIRYEFILHTEKDNITIEEVQYYDIMRDYNANIGDYATIAFNMPMGKFNKVVYPYRDYLEMTVIKKWTDNAYDAITVRYKFVLFNKGGREASLTSKGSEQELDKAGMEIVEGQLVLRELEGLRSIFVDGIYKDITVKDLLIGLIGNTVKKIEIEGNAFNINIDVVEPANTTEYKNLVVPTGIQLIDLPSFLQNTDYGVYNGGIGTFLQMYNKKFTLFIYPLYSTMRYDEATGPTLTIFHTNTSKYDMVESTYRVEDKKISIIAGSNITSSDTGANRIMSKGDGLIASYPDAILDRNIEVSDDGITFDKETQLKGVAIVERNDKQNKGRYVGIDSNMFRQRTNTIRNTMATYMIPWQFSDPDLIYPGMPCCFMYEDSRKGLVKLNGIVNGIYTKYDNMKHVQQSLLVIMVESPNVYQEKKK